MSIFKMCPVINKRGWVNTVVHGDGISLFDNSDNISGETLRPVTYLRIRNYFLRSDKYFLNELNVEAVFFN